MRKMKDKVKRKHVQWHDVLINLDDLELSAQYWKFKSDHKEMSANRCAWNVLKRNYSTTTLAYYRMFGEWPR